MSQDRRFPNLKEFKQALRKTYQPYIDAIDKTSSEYKMLLVNIERCFGNIEPIFETPRITPTFSHVSGYREFFLVAQQWYSRRGSDKVFSSITSKLKSIWETYELFCLVRIIEALNHLGFRMVGSRRSDSGTVASSTIDDIFDLGRDDGTW